MKEPRVTAGQDSPASGKTEDQQSTLPELTQIDGLDVREADDLLPEARLSELRMSLARDARTRREAEATSATLRMG
jgi:hypothetical protein